MAGSTKLALGILHAGLIGWAFLPAFWPVGLLLLLGAAINLWRLLRWRGIATTAEPLLLVLHVGYAWLVLGVALLGLAVLDADVPLSAAIHALTAGAIGTMILAVMTRATRGHTGRDLSADRVTVLIYGLVTLAAITRVAAAFGCDLDHAASHHFGRSLDLRLRRLRTRLWANADPAAARPVSRRRNRLSRTCGGIPRRLGVTFQAWTEGAIRGPTTSPNPLAKV